jgi:hypothetical protein
LLHFDIGSEIKSCIPTGKFTIKNKEDGLFLSIVDGTLAFTKTKGTNSDWFVQDSNEVWGTIESSFGFILGRMWH